jgi:predicted nucleic acid-binding protein
VRAVLVDTGPLVGLLDDKDPHHSQAREELAKLKGPFLVGLPVLCEALHFLTAKRHRAALALGFDKGLFQVLVDDGPGLTSRTLKWLEHFAEHDPDFTDGHLVSWAERDAGLAVWTFDSEFRTVWRTLKGKKVRLAVR